MNTQKITLNSKEETLQYAKAGKFVIYGAGQFGITLMRFVAANGLMDNCTMFAVSKQNKSEEEIMGVPVFSVAELQTNSRVLIATHPKFHNEIWDMLAEHYIKDVSIISRDCYLQIRRTIPDFWTEQFLAQRQIKYDIDILNILKSLQNVTKNEISILCDLYGSDKGTTIGNNKCYYNWRGHTYTTIYEYLFNPIRTNCKNIFECGIGANFGILPKSGASLRVWRDYFPNASIFGADIDKSLLFTENRIQTDYIDQTNPIIIKAFFEKFDKNSFDIMIDDGLHTLEAATKLLENSIEYLSNDGLYIIEDLSIQDIKDFREIVKLKFKNLEVRYWLMNSLNSDGNNLIVINKKKI